MQAETGGLKDFLPTPIATGAAAWHVAYDSQISQI